MNGPSAQEILNRLELFGVRLGLEASRRLLAALGHPERRLPAVLVAGTNGKGSTAALLAAMATAAGYRTGLYTSPHLEEVEERLRIDGRAVARPRLGELLREVMAAADSALDHPPTYFEALTAAAFLHFAQEGCELAVLEVGMGGRLDATNAAQPVLSVISAIGLDHREQLGGTVEAIAREKAGILRPGRPAVVAPGELARQALRHAADAVGAALLPAAERVEVLEVTERGLAGQRVRLRTARGEQNLELALAGRHQVDNLVLAVAAAERLAEEGWNRLGGDAVAAGVAACRWPARLEEVALPAGRSVLLDAAHNPDGAATLGRALRQLDLPYDLLFGTLADKDAAAMLPPLAAAARRVTLTRPPSGRGRAVGELVELLDGRTALAEPDLDRALTAALAGQGRLLVSGSLYLVGEVRKRLRQRFGVPAPAVEISTFAPPAERAQPPAGAQLAG